MNPIDWITGGAATGMFVLSLGAVAISHGAHRARTDGLEADVKGLDERVQALEALKISVEGLTRGIEHLGERLVDSQKLSGSELARLADQLAAGQRLMDARFDAMKELSARELDEVKHGVRNIRQTLERDPRVMA
ncbi:MAG: hypothetical protein P4L64_06870 [Caulobacteraceae bacterium]|nr:hypothetical protein [Caulobacteraceae bacterium]